MAKNEWTWFEGKEKAWASALAGFLVTYISQGGQVDPAQIADMTTVFTDIGVSLVAAGVGFLATWLTTNTGTPDVVSVPVEVNETVEVVPAKE